MNKLKKFAVAAAAVLVLSGCGSNGGGAEEAPQGDRYITQEFGSEELVYEPATTDVDVSQFNNSPALVAKAIGDDGCSWGEDQYDTYGDMRHVDCGDIEISVFPSADAVVMPDYGSEFYAYQAENVLIGAYDKADVEAAVAALTDQ